MSEPTPRGVYNAETARSSRAEGLGHMSAFMVSDNHIAFLCLAVRTYMCPPGSNMMPANDLDEVGRIFKAECARSVTHRYPRDAAKCRSWCA